MSYRSLLVGFLVLYSLPILSIVFFPLNRWIKYCWLHALFGRIEWFFSLFRDGLVALLILVFVVYSFIKSFKTDPSYLPFIFLSFIGLSFWSYYFRRHRVRLLTEFITGKFVLDPSEFFKLYFASVSGLPGKLPKFPSRVVKLPINYSSSDRSCSILPAIPGVVDTAILARMVVRASKWRGAQFCSRVADAVSAIWGARVVQLASAGLSVEGLQKLNSVSGRTIFVCNHKSFVDFAIIPVALGLINLERKIGFKLRFMAARDHFFDNQFLYRIVGIGKAMEKVGTIFVDRKSKNKKATEAVSEAAASMIEEGLDIVMYPQGTRAFGNKDKRGQRLDAGYYTTGSERNLLKNRGHLKKGVAYLAADVAASLAKRGQELNIVPIGLVGTGTIVPRGKIRIQKGVAMKVIIGDPIVVGPQACEGDRAELVESLLDMIDARLKEVLRIHEGLKKRLLLDVRGMMREGDIDRFLEALRAWRDDEDLIFSIIDCIYSLPAKLWRSYFRRLANLLGEMDTSREKLIEFKGIVVAEMVKHR